MPAYGEALDTEIKVDSASLQAQLRALYSPDRSEQVRKYLKLNIDCYGVRLPEIRRLTRGWANAQGPWAQERLIASAWQLWELEVIDLRLATVELLRYRKKLLDPASLPDIENMIRQSHTWALVDELSAVVAGHITTTWPDQTGAILDIWANDTDFWLRRSALLTQLPVVRTAAGNPSRFLRYADQMLLEREFFIRKAIGWVLRTMGRKRPGEVFEWILPRANFASGVTIREAVKPLTEAQRAQVLAARQESK